jgi:hypothetical protein
MADSSAVLLRHADQSSEVALGSKESLSTRILPNESHPAGMRIASRSSNTARTLKGKDLRAEVVASCPKAAEAGVEEDRAALGAAGLWKSRWRMYALRRLVVSWCSLEVKKRAAPSAR